MTVYSTVMSIWGFLLVAFVTLMVYRGHLTQHETDQLFLNDEETVSASHVENDDVIRKVNRIQPFCQGVGGAFAALSVAAIGMVLLHLSQGALLVL